MKGNERLIPDATLDDPVPIKYKRLTVKNLNKKGEKTMRRRLIICIILLSLFVPLNLFQGLVAPGFTPLALERSEGLSLASDYTFTTIDFPGAKGYRSPRDQ